MFRKIDVNIIDGKAFDKCTNLKSLELIDVRIGNEITLAFDNLANLTNMILNYNKVLDGRGDIQDFFDNHLPMLKEMSISHNIIKELKNNAFFPFASLEILELQCNEIATIEAGAFNGLDNLRHLNLEWNKIAIMEISVLDVLPNLITLCCELISTFLFTVANRNLLPENLKPLIANIHYQPTTRNLDHNRINNILKDDLKYLAGLIKINLAENEIKEISQESFQNLVDVVDICLNENSISRLDQNMFHDLPELKYLDLSFNKIGTDFISSSVFQNLTSIEIL
ncbi:uncharacterized protein TRIADDRAFT_62196 [Trichoplax adhaerens]|uniref:Uncharacterized protein n=1 Tax=Trichoplax adhaerens TaxID=10228 RepID=B3SD40_TRIAD|nr:hypothetical protein TRIADDRAFT_62196 [Trichoplax adhaerens]EDV19377.1 hypothetical protein TRIADDRAFT_62196 [Trichoplax adhaerens]|eukprot:XP_002118152.1 hypothetical protein TRIADDRAFT_62196 [Trichoplax adhaerens]